jgi:hypothetical protein
LKEERDEKDGTATGDDGSSHPAGGVAQAIINGEPDRGPKAHPYAGALVTKVEGHLVKFCSGTLIKRIFLVWWQTWSTRT